VSGYKYNPMQLEICPDETAARIRAWLRNHPEIAKGYNAQEGSVYNHCYVASEAYFHANGGKGSGIDIYCLSWSDVDPGYDGTHWYLKDDSWIDLSLETVDDGTDIPFEQGRRRAFITGYEPSQRAERINEDLDLW